ncbi:MAG: hypothetical protein R3B47_16940 [Bacteroidia bacterium]
MKFKSKEVVSYKKLRGGYYTPKVISDFISCWVLESSPESVLEPSFGDGNLLEALLNGAKKLNLRNIDITGIELDFEEYIKGIRRVGSIEHKQNINLINQDFLCLHRFWRRLI